MSQLFYNAEISLCDIDGISTKSTAETGSAEPDFVIMEEISLCDIDGILQSTERETSVMCKGGQNNAFIQ